MKRTVGIKTYLLGLMSLSMASFLLVHFAMIWAWGRFYVYESSPVVLSLETTMVVAMLFFSVYCVLEQLQRERARGSQRGQQDPHSR